MSNTTREWRTLATVAVFAFSVPMTACSQSSVSGNQPRQPVCLDRLLMDLPATVEVGASNVVYQGGYNFPGVTSIGAKGVRWNGITLDETHVTDVHGYETIHLQAISKLWDESSYNATLRAKNKELRIWVEQLNNGTKEEQESTNEFVEKTKKAIAETHRLYKVSGSFNVTADNTFIVRDDDAFKIGYLDPTDYRVRYFEGQLSAAEIAIDSPEAAAQEFERLRRIYHRRDITDIPTGPGYCTAHGFIDEPADYKPQVGDSLNLPFRSLKYPNLVFILIIERPYANAPRNAMEQENPNVVTTKDIQNLKGMAAIGALAALGQIKRTYGPKRIEMAGQTGGRLYGREYHNKGYLEENGPATAYEFEAEVMGEPGRTDRPHIKLQMGAALADAPDLPAGQEPIRPALKGHVPPSFEEGLKIFEEVVKSVRLRPVVHADGVAGTSTTQ